MSKRQVIAERRLELAGFVLMAAGLITLAFEDPIIRILIYGTSVGAGAAAARAQFASGGGAAGSFTALRGSSAAGGTTEILATFSAFGACVVGLVLVVTAALTQNRPVSGKPVEPETTR